MEKWNKGRLFGVLVLLGWTLFLMYLLMTDTYLQFMHPGRKGMLWMAEIGLILLLLYQSTKVSLPMKKKEGRGYIPLAIALGCGVFAIMPIEAKPQTQAQTQEQTQAGTQVQIGVEQDAAAVYNQIDPVSFGVTPQNQELFSIEEMIQQDTYLFTEDNYVDLLGILQDNPQLHVGKKVQLEGFVYREEGFLENEFVLGRMYMICCAADAQVVGLLSEWEGAGTLHAQDWLEVEGVIAVKTFEMNGLTEPIPYIQVTKVEKKEAPAYPYVY